MIFFKYIITQDYSNDISVIECLINYVWNPYKTNTNLCGVRAVINDIPCNIAKQFFFTHICYNTISDDLIVHLVVSFSKDTFLTSDEVKIAADAIADIIGCNYQVIYGIHTNEPNLHIHFIINSISYNNGQSYKINTTLIPVFYMAVKKALYNNNTLDEIGRFAYEID